MVRKAVDNKKASHLFAGWQETLIWSCLQDVMGCVYVDSPDNPESAMALLGDFCFLAGRPDKELVCYKPEGWKRNFVIMVPENQEWGELIEACFGERAEKVSRYATKKEPDVFDRRKLKRAVELLPEGYTLKMMDKELFSYCRETFWCRDWVLQYEDYAMYERYGLGAVILRKGEPVSGASSYSGYHDGIEIEIDTREDYRRKGLAYICGAKLILECLERGWYPSWDAQNRGSLALAEKLGYHFAYEYPAYEIRL